MIACSMVELAEISRGVRMQMPQPTAKQTCNSKEVELENAIKSIEDTCKNELQEILISTRGEQGKKDFEAFVKRLDNKELSAKSYKELSKDEEYMREEQWLANIATDDGVE